MSQPVSPSVPRFEIVDERYMRKRRPKKTATSGWVGTFFGTVRAVIEDGYVSLAKGVMVRAEQLEDVRAGRGYAKRARKAERQALRRGPKERNIPHGKPGRPRASGVVS